MDIGIYWDILMETMKIWIIGILIGKYWDINGYYYILLHTIVVIDNEEHVLMIMTDNYCYYSYDWEYHSYLLNVLLMISTILSDQDAYGKSWVSVLRRLCGDFTNKLATIAGVELVTRTMGKTHRWKCWNPERGKTEGLGGLTPSLWLFSDTKSPWRSWCKFNHRTSRYPIISRKNVV